MSEIERVAAAFEQKDYRTASELLKKLYKTSPQDPWVQLYIARLQEVSGKVEASEKIYRQLLRGTTIPKVLAQARQGLQRLEEKEKQKRQQALALAKADPRNAEPGILVLEPVSAEAKPQAAKNLARIMNTDPYTARLLLPSQGWRAYRTGTIGELQVYSQELLKAGIPNFCASLAEVNKINVFRVCYFQSVSPQATVICKNEADQLGVLSFNWLEVSQRVEALLPVFEQVVEYNLSRNEVERKESTQDYAHFCDLHLPNRNCILRLNSFTYEFQQGVELTAAAEKSTGYVTNRLYWNNLIDLLKQKLPNATVWSNFFLFAETVQDYPELLRRVKPHIDLFRREPTDLDPAFQLYSALIFVKNRRK